VNPCFQIVHRCKREPVAAVDRVETFPGRSPEPFDFGRVFPLTLLQKLKAFAHHVAGIGETPGADAGLNLPLPAEMSSDEELRTFCGRDCWAGALV